MAEEIITERTKKLNEYARRIKAGETLTPEELAERDALRREYIDSVVGNLKGHLDNTYFVDEKGNKRKLTDVQKSGKTQ